MFEIFRTLRALRRNKFIIEKGTFQLDHRYYNYWQWQTKHPCWWVLAPEPLCDESDDRFVGGVFCFDPPPLRQILVKVVVVVRGSELPQAAAKLFRYLHGFHHPITVSLKCLLSPEKEQLAQAEDDRPEPEGPECEEWEG